jgi:hypothetical protein
MRARLVVSAFLVLGGSAALAQTPRAPAEPARTARPTRPPLFLKEDWQQIPGGGEHPVTPASLTNANVEMTLYGASSKEIQLTGTAGDDANPVHVWSGLCTTPCGVTLRDKTRFVDLTGLARIQWNTKTSGFHAVRPLVKLADGTLLVGDHTDGTPLDWLTTEFSVASVRWLELDPERLVTIGNFVAEPDLTKVDEVGFVDLLPSSGHGPGGWSDVAQVEVYGKPVPR